MKQDLLTDLDALVEAGRRCDELSERLREETAQRDALVRKLSSAGFTRREVAEAARLTAGRVQQIVGNPDAEGITARHPQRVRALERANEIRHTRAELKRRIADGDTSAAEVILSPPSAAMSWGIGDLLMSQRRWGATRCRKFLLRNQINENKTIGALTDRQRRLLADQLRTRTTRHEVLELVGV